MENAKESRRRGKALEEAILQSAWEELCEVGYAHLSMEGIAARAKTNKAVLYRRWQNKTELVIAAFHKYMPNPSQEIPNTGNLRTDLLTYLQTLVKPLEALGTQTIREFMTEASNNSLIASLPRVIRPREESRLNASIVSILKQAEQRGEIETKERSMRITSLPMDLIRYELLSRQVPISTTAIEEIIDELFLPLILNA